MPAIVAPRRPAWRSSGAAIGPAMGLAPACGNAVGAAERTTALHVAPLDRVGTAPKPVACALDLPQYGAARQRYAVPCRASGRLCVAQARQARR
jgi:hypothetical protein